LARQGRRREKLLMLNANFILKHEPINPIINRHVALAAGNCFGYYARQSLAKKQAGNIEQKLQQKYLRAELKLTQLSARPKKRPQNF